MSATGRLRWASFPAAFRDDVERHFQGRATHAVTPSGGHSADMAERLQFDNGRRVFVKGCGPDADSDSFELHQAEACIAGSLPSTVPAPRMLATFEADGWLAIAFEDIDGRLPTQPWKSTELAKVLSTVALLPKLLTPSPLADAPTVEQRLGEVFHGWRRLRSSREADEDLGWLDPWALQHLDELAGLESGWGAAAAGDGLAHADLRADNMLVSDGQVFVVDWPWACRAAAWFDLLGMLPSIELAGGPDAETTWAGHPLGREANQDAATVTLAARAGFFLRQGHQPPPPGAPALRTFQQEQGRIALRWLRRRLDL